MPQIIMAVGFGEFGLTEVNNEVRKGVTTQTVTDGVGSNSGDNDKVKKMPCTLGSQHAGGAE